MKTSLVHFLSTDNLRLPGLLYEPEIKTKQAAIFLHGCGSSSIFYKPEMNIFADIFTRHNIAFFPFNNRGAHLIKTLKQESGNEESEAERITAGTYYEIISDCTKDIDGAIHFLRGQGFETFYLIGHSTGANKIAVYHYNNTKNPISKYILLAGGDDTGLTYEMMGEKRFKQALTRCEKELRNGNGDKPVPKYIYPEPYSFRALYDVINPEGDYNTFPFYEYLNNQKLSAKPLFREYQSINKPVLVVYGEHDEFCYGNVPACIEALKEHTKSQTDAAFEIIPETGHGFDGKEKELGGLMARWLTSSLH